MFLVLQKLRDFINHIFWGKGKYPPPPKKNTYIETIYSLRYQEKEEYKIHEKTLNIIQYKKLIHKSCW